MAQRVIDEKMAAEIRETLRTIRSSIKSTTLLDAVKNGGSDIALKGEGVPCVQLMCTVSRKNAGGAAASSDDKPGASGVVDDASTSRAASDGSGDAGSAASRTRASYRLQGKFGSFKNVVISKRDFGSVSTNGESMVIRLRPSTNMTLRNSNAQVTLPKSRITGREISHVVINKHDYRMIFTSDKKALECSGELSHLLGVTAAYGLRKPPENMGTQAAPIAITTVSTKAPMVTIAPAASSLSLPLLFPPQTPAPLPPVAGDEANGQVALRSNGAHPYVPTESDLLDPLNALLGFRYEPTCASGSISVDDETMKDYYRWPEGPMPTIVAMCLEVEHPEIIPTELASNWNMCATVTWNSEAVTPVMPGITSIPATRLGQEVDKLENMWHIIDAIDNSPENLDGLLHKISGRKFRIVHRGLPSDTSLWDATIIKMTSPGPGSDHEVEFGVLHKEERSMGEPEDPWLSKLKEKGNTFSLHPRLTGRCIARCWGPGVEPSSASEMRTVIVNFVSYEEKVAAAFGIKDSTTWKDLGGILTSRGIVALDCLVNVEQTRMVKGNRTFSWTKLANCFVIVADVLAISAEVRPAIEAAGKPLSIEQVCSALRKQVPSSEHLENNVRPMLATLKNFPNIIILTRKSHEEDIHYAMLLGYQFREISVSAGSDKPSRVYVMAYRPTGISADGMNTGKILDGTNSESTTAIDKSIDALRSEIFENGGFYYGDGRPRIIDDANVGTMCAERGISYGLDNAEILDDDEMAPPKTRAKC